MPEVVDSKIAEFGAPTDARPGFIDTDHWLCRFSVWDDIGRRFARGRLLYSAGSLESRIVSHAERNEDLSHCGIHDRESMAGLRISECDSVSLEIDVTPLERQNLANAEA